MFSSSPTWWGVSQPCGTFFFAAPLSSTAAAAPKNSQPFFSASEHHRRVPRDSTDCAIHLHPMESFTPLLGLLSQCSSPRPPQTTLRVLCCYYFNVQRARPRDSQMAGRRITNTHESRQKQRQHALRSLLCTR